MSYDQAEQLVLAVSELKSFLISEDMPNLYAAIVSLTMWMQGLFIALSVLIFLQAVAVFRRR